MGPGGVSEDNEATGFRGAMDRVDDAHDGDALWGVIAGGVVTEDAAAGFRDLARVDEVDRDAAVGHGRHPVILSAEMDGGESGDDGDYYADDDVEDNAEYDGPAVGNAGGGVEHEAFGGGEKDPHRQDVEGYDEDAEAEDVRPDDDGGQRRGDDGRGGEGNKEDGIGGLKGADTEVLGSGGFSYDEAGGEQRQESEDGCGHQDASPQDEGLVGDAWDVKGCAGTEDLVFLEVVGLCDPGPEVGGTVIFS